MSKASTKSPLFFYGIALVLPLLFFLVIELGLRVSGYGQTIPLIVQLENKPEYSFINSEWIKRYFHVSETPPNVSPDTHYFHTEKQANTLRIVVMGGSTAAGFPYGRFGSPGSIVQQTLLRANPLQDVEVINVAMSSINSYALRDVVDEVVSLQPDAVLIYAGHNEYLGVMGVGSVLNASGNHLANLLFLNLKNSRIFQLLQGILAKKPSNIEDKPANPRSVMANVASGQSIPIDSHLFEQGIAQFKSNLSAVLNAFEKASIPVVLSTLVSNERDLPPFKSGETDAPLKAFCDFPQVEAETTNKHLSQLALKQFELHVDNAKAQYIYAQCLEKSGQTVQSIHHYVQAKDKDYLRFRAPEAFNAIIKELTSRDKVYLADTQRQFRTHSQGYAIGDSLMLEHLHPNSKGYGIIAASFVASLFNNNLVEQGPKINTNQLPYNLGARYALTPIDELVAKNKIGVLTNDYPFNNYLNKHLFESNNSAYNKFARQRIAGEPWLAQQQSLLAYFQSNNDFTSAAKIAGLLHQSLPWENKMAFVAANLYMNAGDLNAALYYGRTAHQSSPNDINHALTYSEVLFKLGHAPIAKDVLMLMVEKFPQNEKLRYYLNIIGEGKGSQ